MHCCSARAACLAAGSRGAVDASVVLAPQRCLHQDVQHILTRHLTSASRQLPAALHRLKQCGSLRWMEAACIAPTHGACLSSPRQKPNTRWCEMFLECMGGHLDVLIHGRCLPGLSFT